nr:short chain dehydrogenase andi [Quercus suber]
MPSETKTNWKLSLQDIPRPTKTYHTETYDRISKHHGFKGNGKTVLVTGGATGIGFSISRAFAAAGVARVVHVARSPDTLAKAKNELETAFPATQVLTFQASITDLVRVKEILQELGTLDVLVLSATFIPPMNPLVKLSTKDVTESFDTTVVAAWEFVRAYLATPMPVAGQKTVLGISTMAAQMRLSNTSPYGTAKAAITQMLQHFAAEHVESGSADDVRFFSFHPGAILTPAAEKAITQEQSDFIPWEDIKLPADFAVWLAGSESTFLNGRFLSAHWDVDGLIELKERLAQDPLFLTIGLVL